MRLIDGRGTVAQVTVFLAERQTAREIGIPSGEFVTWLPCERAAMLALAERLGRACLRAVAAGRLSLADLAAYLAEPVADDVPPFPTAAGDKRTPSAN